MTIEEAQQIIEDDDDYDEDGNLKDDIKIEYAEKHNDDDMDDEDDSDPYGDSEDDEDDED